MKGGGRLAEHHPTHLTMRAPWLSGEQITIREPFGAERLMAVEAFFAESGSDARQQMVEPDPLSHPPIAPAFTPASTTSLRKGTNLDR
jgi:hypothetical protein